MSLRFASILVLLVLLLVIFLQNTGATAVRLLVWEVTMPLVLLLLVTGAIGFAAGLLLAMTGRRS